MSLKNQYFSFAALLFQSDADSSFLVKNKIIFRCGTQLSRKQEQAKQKAEQKTGSTKGNSESRCPTTRASRGLSEENPPDKRKEKKRKKAVQKSERSGKEKREAHFFESLAYDIPLWFSTKNQQLVENVADSTICDITRTVYRCLYLLSTRFHVGL